MKHLLTRVAQRLLALSFLSAAPVTATAAPDLAATRQAAAQILPKLQSGSWQASEEAFHTINQLSASKEAADKQLAEKLTGLCAAAIEKGIRNMPPPPEDGRLLRNAGALAGSLLDNPTVFNVKQARAVVGAWERAQPDNLNVRMLTLKLHVADKKRDEQIKLSSALVHDQDLSPADLDYVRNVQVSALLRGRPPTAEELGQAGVILDQWLKQEPAHLRARQLLLELHHARQDWPAQYALATELLKDEKLTGSDRKWVRQRRLEGAVNTGKTSELNEEDWNYMLEQFTGGKGLKQFIDQHGQLLLGVAFGIGWLWFFIVAWLTRCVRTGPPRLWLLTLWCTIILYASTVIMVSQALRIIFSLLGLLILIFGVTGGRAPLGYLVPPQPVSESGRGRWLGVLGWCIASLVLIHLFTLGYALAFERVMGRPLESQFVARLLQTETLPRLLGMVLAGGVFVPFLEEVVFRGLMQDWLGRRLPAFLNVVLVSSVFGVIHGLEMAVPIAFIGMLLSLLRLRYRSLWPCIMLHSLNNSLMIILLYAAPGMV
ncbi:lysostaphin resistance A-like protein [Prosthecobacter sp.]|uniref:lysostaphin resistance A-like protein n=1 Tax=Prosthecobacter sp. TaxID=1965333 RepID=UPI00378463C1